MLHNEQEFLNAVLPSGYHIVDTPIATVRDILDGSNGAGVPVPRDTPWYASLADDQQETDQFTAWLLTAYARAEVNPTNTDEWNVNKVLAFMAFDLIRYRGLTDDTADAMDAIAAVVVGGAAYIRERGHAPTDAKDFVASYLN